MRRELETALELLEAQAFDRAQAEFDACIDRMPGAEQRLYRGFSLVAEKEDLAHFEKAPETRKPEIARRFWASRDPVPLTRANERLLEHYRRVAYARAHFSRGVFPWDDRGTIYVRLGAPDHVTRFNDVRRTESPEVRRARLGFAGRFLPGTDVRSGYPTFPLGQDDRWEYWVYTGIEKGLEITFVNRNIGGGYDFASMPGGGYSSGQAGIDLLALQGIINGQPPRYRPDFMPLSVDFSYDLIDFRAPDGRTRLEVTCGLHASEAVALSSDERTGLILLERCLVFYDSLWNEVYRIQDRVNLQPPTEEQVLDRAFLPGMMTVDLPPGAYYLAFQVRDAGSGRSQVYRQAVVLEDYTGTEDLRLSDVELAFAVSPADSAGDFVKHGLRVIPRSSRVFSQDRHAFAYFEIYNLSRDGFGQTKYRVEYTLRENRGRSLPGRLIHGLGRLFRLAGKDRGVTIAYEQDGDRADEQAYVALDLNRLDPGDQLVQVAVTDLLNGQTVAKETGFEIVP